MQRALLWVIPSNNLLTHCRMALLLTSLPQAAGEGRDHGVSGALPYRRPCGRGVGGAGAVCCHLSKGAERHHTLGQFR